MIQVDPICTADVNVVHNHTANQLQLSAFSHTDDSNWLALITLSIIVTTHHTRPWTHVVYLTRHIDN